MGLEAVQWIVLGVGCFNVALGIYSLATDRLPRLPFVWRGGFNPRRYGWAQLLMAVFVFTVALGPVMMEAPYELSIAVIFLGFGAFIAGICLMHSGKPTQRSS
ncbi:hypothetical protein [Streptosporangium sp. NPDC000396]|uniref:hypothetical protein n=1 Tax=Streptosporangium sp. NPDC000396 TaxID=3366185 RepID=UPI0036CD2F21